MASVIWPWVKRCAPSGGHQDIRGRAHGFDSAGQDDLGIAGLDLLDPEGQGLHGRRALALNGDRRDFDRDTGLQGGGAGRVGLVRALAAIAQNDIVQLISGDMGSFKDLGDDGGGQLMGPMDLKASPNLPMGVRAAATITTSFGFFKIVSSFSLVEIWVHVKQMTSH